MQKEVRKVIDKLKRSEISSYIDTSLTPPDPFRGSGKIRLIILGQDPTVQDPENRKKIKVTLLLNQPGRLRTYLEKVCKALEIDLDENIYATNLLKNFFTVPRIQCVIRIRNSFRRQQPIGFHFSKKRLRNLKMFPSCRWVSPS